VASQAAGQLGRVAAASQQAQPPSRHNLLQVAALGLQRPVRP
jgi:hypothetical protein